MAQKEIDDLPSTSSSSSSSCSTIPNTSRMSTPTDHLGGVPLDEVNEHLLDPKDKKEFYKAMTKVTRAEIKARYARTCAKRDGRRSKKHVLDTEIFGKFPKSKNSPPPTPNPSQGPSGKKTEKNPPKAKKKKKKKNPSKFNVSNYYSKPPSPIRFCSMEGWDH